VISLKKGALDDALGAGSLTVYTSDFEEAPPARATGLTAAAAPGNFPVLNWTANTDAALCYYRVYRSLTPEMEPKPANQIGSTVATTFTDETAGRKLTYYYKVCAVDKWGNVGPPSAVAQAAA
jgi:fibronectin type 3 domain-containing protein